MAQVSDATDEPLMRDYACVCLVCEIISCVLVCICLLLQLTQHLGTFLFLFFFCFVFAFGIKNQDGPSDEKIRATMKAILEACDLTTTSSKNIRKQTEKVNHTELCC